MRTPTERRCCRRWESAWCSEQDSEMGRDKNWCNSQRMRMKCVYVSSIPIKLC